MAIQTRLSSGETGVTLIRFGLGSYFLAIAAGVIQGTDPGAAFALVLPDHIATLVGTAALLGASALLILGLRPGLAVGALAGLILAATLAQNLLASGVQDMSALWRDVILVCAVILTHQTARLTAIAPARVQAEDVAQAQELPDRDALTAEAQAPCPMPRRVTDTGKPRTARPNLPKVRKLAVDQLAPAARDPGASGDVGQDRDAGPADADPRFDVVPRKVTAKAPRERFKLLPLTSPYDHPRENIFAQI
jgi:hypothetical protein